MPAVQSLASSQKASKKRSAPSASTSRKKAKATGADVSDLQTVSHLTQELLDPKTTDCRSLGTLLGFLNQQSYDARVNFKAAYSIQRIFVRFFNEGRFQAGPSEAEKIVVSWLRTQYKNFILSLCSKDWIRSSDSNLRVSSQFQQLGPSLTYHRMLLLISCLYA